jgi:hypothetical protein
MAASADAHATKKHWFKNPEILEPVPEIPAKQ